MTPGFAPASSSFVTADFQLPLAQGEAEFSLHPDYATLNSLQVSTGHLLLEANGSLTNWSDPVLTALYKVSADTSEAAAMFAPIGAGAASASPLRQFSGGSLEINGSGVFSRESFTTSGKAIFKDVNWTAEPLVIRNVSGRSWNFRQIPKALPCLICLPRRWAAP